MPQRPPRVCGKAGCPTLVVGAPRCPAHTTAPNRGSSTKQGYGSPWRKARAAYLAKHPLCVYCAKEGKQTKATCIDHIKAHKGDKKLFWDVENNWAACCKECNAKKCAASEGGFGNPMLPTFGKAIQAVTHAEHEAITKVPAEGYWLI